MRSNISDSSKDTGEYRAWKTALAQMGTNSKYIMCVVFLTDEGPPQLTVVSLSTFHGDLHQQLPTSKNSG